MAASAILSPNAQGYWTVAELNFGEDLKAEVGLPRTPLKRSSRNRSLPITPSGGPILRRGHNIVRRYCRVLTYTQPPPSSPLHKKSYRIGPGLCGTSENSFKSELRRMPISRSSPLASCITLSYITDCLM